MPLLDDYVIITTATSPFMVSGVVFGAVVGAMGTLIIILTIIAFFTTTMAYLLGSKTKSTLSIDSSNLTHELNRDQRSSHISTDENIAYESVLQVTHNL